MDPRRFDALAKAVAGSPGLPRRRLLRRAGAAAALLALARPSRGGAQDEGTPEGGRVITLACEPCFCGASGCECCLSGVTGGGVVRTADGDAQLVLFASRLEAGSTGAAGFVRWFMPEAGDGSQGLTLESVGPIAYGLPESPEDPEREIRGAMAANGSGEHPFVLHLRDAGPEALGQDTADLIVGDPSAGAGFAYQGGGTLVGGDLQLLGGVGPVR